MTIIDIEEQLYYYGARYLGDTRIVTKLNSGENPTYQEESRKQYYYHSDHLRSASLISDYQGDEYQRLEYTPYGETWVEKTQNTGLEYLPYKFTAKELDEETGLYYYGARYLDPKYSMWISTDPALGDYIPQAPVNDEAKKHNQNLPGMGGVFNHINSNLYHYAGNNPVKYTDPDGRAVQFVVGAVVGATLSGAVAAYDSHQETGSINWKTVGISAAGGAVSGIIAATGIGLAGQIAINGSIGATVCVSDSVANGKKIDTAGLGEAIGVGMLSGLFGGAGAGNSAVTSQMSRMGKRMANAFRNKTGDARKKEWGNAIKYYMKHGGKKTSVETYKAVLRATLSPIIETADDKIKDTYKNYMNNLSDQETQ